MFIIRIKGDFSTVTHSTHQLVLIIFLNCDLSLSFRYGVAVIKGNHLVDLLLGWSQIYVTKCRHLFDCLRNFHFVSLLIMNVYATLTIYDRLLFLN